MELFNEVIEKASKAMTYREINLLLLEYMQSEKVVNKEKEYCMFTNSTTDCWVFTLSQPTCDKYYDQHVVGSVIAKNMCCNILTAVEEEKITVPSENMAHFSEYFIKLIDAIFPEGQNTNQKVYEYQCNDFGIKFDPNQEKPSLNDIRNYRRELLTALIKLLIKKNKLNIAIEIFKLYGNKYGIGNRTLLENIPVEMANESCKDNHDIENRNLVVNLTKLRALDNLTEFDLKFILSAIDAEEKNKVHRKPAFLKTVAKLQNSGVALQSRTDCINKNLLKEISELKETFILRQLTEEQRYYLSILVREYDEFKFVPSDELEGKKEYYARIKDLRQIIENKLNEIEAENERKLLEDFESELSESLNREMNKQREEFNKKLSKQREKFNQELSKQREDIKQEVLEDFNKAEFEENHKKGLFIDFLKLCEKCKAYEGYETFPFKNINYENLYDKAKANRKIVDFIAASQHRFSHIENFDFGEGDFTFAIAVQVKVIERYLKEVIVQNMKNITIYSGYHFPTKSPKKNDQIKDFTIKNNCTAEHLSGWFNIELATAGFIVCEIGGESCLIAPNDVPNDNSNFFHPYNDYQSSFDTWRKKVRNGYFHIHPVKNMKEAREIHYKTAFCLMKCISLLKPLTR